MYVPKDYSYVNIRLEQASGTNSTVKPVKKKKQEQATNSSTTQTFKQTETKHICAGFMESFEEGYCLLFRPHRCFGGD